jgi:NADH-quinone oxidoreductase subunit L
MLLPVGVLAVLATVGGWLQFAPLWHPFTNWLRYAAAPPFGWPEPSNTLEYLTSVVVVLAGLAGIAIAWAIYAEKSLEIPKLPAVQRLLENKFYFDEIYDRVFYAPAVQIAGLLRSEVEEPVILQGGADLGQTTLHAGGVVRRIQTGVLRTYVFFLAAGAAALVLAFLIAK